MPQRATTRTALIRRTLAPAESYSQIGKCRKSRENASFQAWAQVVVGRGRKSHCVAQLVNDLDGESENAVCVFPLTSCVARRKFRGCRGRCSESLGTATGASAG